MTQIVKVNTAFNMKTTLILALLSLLLLTSCTKEGEVQNKSKQHIIINGEEYYFLQVVPADGEKGVWLLIPKDSKVELPQVISYDYNQYCGKHCTKVVHVQATWIKHKTHKT